MKRIPLTQGFKVIVDKTFVPPGKYSAQRIGRRGVYAFRTIRLINGRKTNRSLHHDVLNISFQNSQQVDHINENGLDNGEKNLRIVTNAENKRAYKRKVLGCLSKFRGYAGIKTIKNGKPVSGIIVDHTILDSLIPK